MGGCRFWMQWVGESGRFMRDRSGGFNRPWGMPRGTVNRLWLSGAWMVVRPYAAIGKASRVARYHVLTCGLAKARCAVSACGACCRCRLLVRSSPRANSYLFGSSSAAL